MSTSAESQLAAVIQKHYSPYELCIALSHYAKTVQQELDRLTQQQQQPQPQDSFSAGEIYANDPAPAQAELDRLAALAAEVGPIIEQPSSSSSAAKPGEIHILRQVTDEDRRKNNPFGWAFKPIPGTPIPWPWNWPNPFTGSNAGRG
ncbi:hypothetical protein LTR05_004742 [Lithohypha guttulata]|uniref:Uncharacterized protein n=1 Tax=Lithohypha guttulata TaxID=1690604 RepID=A0AAN7YG92_9EURO|nr:hypothetical protein LTR05_004742 [Lithohypha guttulata]